MFAKLESLRGLAACLVVLFHSPFLVTATPTAFMENSYLFVDLFFILSGFVMAFAYGEKIQRDLGFASYITLRLGRIYPLHLFMLLAWVPYILVKQYLYDSGFGGTNPADKSNPVSFISNVLMIHAMGIHSYLGWNYPSWSISAEFFAYVAFYLFSVTLDKHKRLYFPLAISLLSYLFLLNLDKRNFDITYDFGFIRCLAAFYIGVLLFRCRGQLLQCRSALHLSLLEGAAVLLVIVCVSYADQNKILLMSAIISFACALVVFSNSENGLLGQILETRLMRLLGVWSYSIYMLHALIWAGAANIFQHLLKIDLDAPQGMLAIIMNTLLLVVIILLSRYSYGYIEKPCRDWVKHQVMQYKNSSSDRVEERIENAQ